MLDDLMAAGGGLIPPHPCALELTLVYSIVCVTANIANRATNPLSGLLNESGETVVLSSNSDGLTA